MIEDRGIAGDVERCPDCDGTGEMEFDGGFVVLKCYACQGAGERWVSGEEARMLYGDDDEWQQ